MAIGDLINSLALDRTSLSLGHICLTVVTALAVGLLIYAFYQKTFSGVMYSRPFHISLVLLNLITTFVVMGIRDNIVISLGMVVALVIVWSRLVVRDPLVLVFFYWSLGAGILMGAGHMPIALIGTIAVGAVLQMLAVRPYRESPYLLLMEVESESTEVSVQHVLKNSKCRIKLKSKKIANGFIELVYELHVMDDNSVFVNQLAALNGVVKTNLISSSGSHTG